MVADLIGILLHIDNYFGSVIKDYGIWVYMLLFLIIFFETGLVVAPFLPGDSLLFLAGAFIASGTLSAEILFVVFTAAAISGDTINYYIGSRVGKRILRSKNHFIKKEHIEKTYVFYEKHGGKTIVISRFIPFIRTFAPFVAGIIKMKYRKFVSYNVIGGVIWVTSFLATGYYFGNIPLVKNNFGLVILAIVAVTIIAAAVGFFREIKK